MKKSLILILSLYFLNFSCSKKPETFAEYKSWFNNENNGFIKTTVINEYFFKVQYRPLVLQIINELDEFKPYSREEIEDIKESYGQSTYFLMEIGINDYTSIKDNSFTDNLEKSLFLISSPQENVKLVIRKDSFIPALSHFERGSELRKSQKFHFAFPTGHLTEGTEITFVYRDEFFAAGKLNFKFKVNNKNIPKLPLRYKK